MKTSLLFFFLLATWSSFAQTSNFNCERLKSYSSKTDQYHIGFLFTVDTLYLDYPNASTAGNENQITNDRSSLTAENNYYAINSYQAIAEMGFLNRNKYLIFRDSVNRIFTNITCIFNLSTKKWDTSIITRNFMNGNWKPEHSEFRTTIQDTLKITGYKFFYYDTENRVIKDSLSKTIQRNIVPDMVHYFGYDQKNHVIFDSIAKYVNNIWSRESANYYTYLDTFLTERKFIAKSGNIQVWQYTKDSFMRKEYSYLAYPDYLPNYERIELLDKHGNVIEYINLNLMNLGDTNIHYKYEISYNNKGNILTNTKKIKDVTGIWFNTEMRQYAYNENNQVVENSLYYFIRPTNSWRTSSKNTYEFNEHSQMTEMKYYVSDDSVSWSDYQLTKYSYTDYGNRSQVQNYEWDTLVNDYSLQSTTNYYWEKYFYNEEMIDTQDDLITAIYPNPSNDVFNLIFECDTDGFAEIGIVDMLGNPVYKNSIPVKKQINNFSWDASEKPSGVYIITIRSNGKIKSLKVLKK